MGILKVIRKKDSLLVIMNNSLVDLPSPSSLTYFWNFGSLLGIFLVFQILTGVFLAVHFSSNTDISFFSVVHMMRDVDWGWLIRVIHANGASCFFLFMYFHIGRGIYFGSYRYISTWLSGVSILLLSMATAFLGYVLPWGQMSFWAATVITNLLSVVPYIGVVLVEWVWGGFAVGNPTLIRFFAFHFLFPFIILFLVVAHLLFLHETGSSNPMGLSGDVDSVVFHPYYIVKDVFGFLLAFMLVMSICLLCPYVFMDVENFIPSNPLVTPVHIQPEWYFLFAYTILRSVPSKVGGVLALVLSVVIYYFFPIIFNHRFRSVLFYLGMKCLFWVFVVNWLLLTWIGSCEVELPYSIAGAHFSVLYFLLFIMMWLVLEFQDKILF